MKKYDKYKTSGIQWIGQIPEGWEVCKFKHFANQITTPSKDSNKIGLENIESATGRFVKTNSEFDGNGIHFLQNDIVYGKLRPYLKKVWMAEFEGNAVGDFFVYRCKDNSFPNFVKYLMLSEGFTDVANGSTTGAKMPRVSSSFISNLSCALPSPDEQRDIAAYLDDKTGKIDKATEAINKQIDDLRSYRQSLISETVTKGLNPDAPMKDSGIQWIGQIPKHWDCVKLRYLVATPLLYGASESGESDKPSFPRYIRITDITENGKLRNSGAKYLNPTIAKRYMLEPGDILFARSGATVGKTFLFTESYPACFAGYLIKVSCGKKLLPSFLYNFTKSGEYQNWVNSISTQATIQNIGADKYSDLNIPLPSPDEQEAISAFLDKKTAKIDEAIKALETQRDDLALLKNSLISEAVTGKVDVRGWNNNHETRN